MFLEYVTWEHEVITQQSCFMNCKEIKFCIQVFKSAMIKILHIKRLYEVKLEYSS